MLARQVLKYSNVEIPVEFGKNFILRYSQDGKVLFQREAKLDNDNLSPTGFLLLQDDEFLVVGYRIDKGKTFLTAEILRSDGNLRTRFNLNPEGTKTSREKTVASPRVFHPTAIRANGQIYVLRGTTTEPIYVLSESGQLLKTIQLKPTDLEFDSPKVLSNELVVRAHSPFSVQSTGIVERTERPRVNLPIFSLETGEIEDRYFWYNETAGLVCASPQFLTFIGQDESAPNFAWTIFETRPYSGKKEASTTGR